MLRQLRKLINIFFHIGNENNPSRQCKPSILFDGHENQPSKQAMLERNFKRTHTTLTSEICYAKLI